MEQKERTEELRTDQPELTAASGSNEAALDEKLDISSAQFDPLLALYSSETPLPFPEVRCFNNIAEYESFMKGGRGRAKPENVDKKLRKARRGAVDPERIERLKMLVVNNPTPTAEGEKSERKPAKKMVCKNVLTRMSLHDGSPLGELNRCVQQRLRVKVHIRSFKGLRGVCTGFVVAFDKFWNLAMVDVDETYREPLLGQAFYHEKALTVTRLFEKLRLQDLQKSSADPDTKPDCIAGPLPSGGQTQAGTPTSQGTVSEPKAKGSAGGVRYGRVRTRHVNQLFIRGENVLLVHVPQQ